MKEFGQVAARRPATDPVTSTNRLIFEGDLVDIGLFRSQPGDRLFQSDGCAREHFIVFPRTSVYIIHEGFPRIVADPNVVVFYNRHQQYRREKLSDRGDICEYFGFAPSVIVAALAGLDPSVQDRPEQPFTRNHGPSDPQTYLLQRLVVEHVLAPGPTDALYVQETALAILERTLENAYPRRQRRAAGAATQRARRELAHNLKSLLATGYDKNLTLTQLAEQLYTSPYHLCRVFRQQTGTTVHRYRTQMRLHVALDYVLESNTDLTTLALGLGFSSHSHFTQSFRQTFGATPSDLREAAAGRRLPQMSKNLIV